MMRRHWKSLNTSSRWYESQFICVPVMPEVATRGRQKELGQSHHKLPSSHPYPWRSPSIRTCFKCPNWKCPEKGNVQKGRRLCLIKERGQKVCLIKKKVSLEWVFIDTFLRLFLVATEGRCVLRTHQLAGSWVAMQTSQGVRVSGDFSKRSGP